MRAYKVTKTLTGGRVLATQTGESYGIAWKLLNVPGRVEHLSTGEHLVLSSEVTCTIQARMLELAKTQGLLPAEADRKWLRENRHQCEGLPVRGEVTLDCAEIFDLDKSEID